MDKFELSMARIVDLQNEFMPYPEWAKAEGLEQCYSQREIWNICLSRTTIFKEASDMKKLNRLRNIGLICIGVAVILEVIGALTKTTVLSIAAFVILLCSIIAYLTLYKCPYCDAFLGGRYGDAIRRTGDKHICPHCNGDLDKK